MCGHMTIGVEIVKIFKIYTNMPHHFLGRMRFSTVNPAKAADGLDLGFSEDSLVARVPQPLQIYRSLLIAMSWSVYYHPFCCKYFLTLRGFCSDSLCTYPCIVATISTSEPWPSSS